MQEVCLRGTQLKSQTDAYHTRTILQDLSKLKIGRVPHSPVPLIRVVIPTYNRADLVAEALQSALEQSFQDFEIVVGDDGSTDHTPEVLRRFATNDSRIRILSLPHGGAAAARNAAIRAPGHYRFVAFLDSDDLWQRDHLKECLEVLSADPQLALVSTAVQVIDQSGQWDDAWQREREDRMRRPIQCAARTLANGAYVLDPERCWQAMLASEFTLQPTTVVIRRDAVPRDEWFDSRLKIFEDPELWLCLARNGRIFVFLDRVHARIRHFGDNLTGTKDALGTQKVFNRYRSVLQFAHIKLGMCRTPDERRIASAEIAWTAYLLGQSCMERGELKTARAYYSQALKHHITYPFLKGYATTWLPPFLCSRLRQRTSGQFSKN